METQIKPQNERQSNLELLRIFAMFLIVLVHYEAHGVKHVSDPDMNMLWRSGSAVNQLFCQLLDPGGKIGVGIFFLLTGYFLCDGKYSLRKLVKLLLTVYFYAILAFLVLTGGGMTGLLPSATGDVKRLLVALIYAVLPVTSEGWWFVTAYFLLYLCIPLINQCTSSLNRMQLVLLLSVTWVFWYASTVFAFRYIGLQRAFFFYLLGTWLKKTDFSISKKASVPLFLAAWGISVFAYIKIGELQTSDSVRALFWEMLYNAVNVAVCVPAAVIALFCFFNRLNIKHSRFINAVSSTTFGIYLMHESVLRDCIWNDVFHCLDVQYVSPFFPLLALGSCVLLFSVLSLLDYARQRFLEKRYMPVVNMLLDRLVLATSDNSKNDR